MIKYILSILLLLIIASFLQRAIPTFHFFYDARILIFVLVFLVSCISLNFTNLLLISFISGLLWDMQHTLGAQGGIEAVYSSGQNSIQFGSSIILFALLGFLMNLLHRYNPRRNWLIMTALTGLVIFLYLTIEYFLIFVVGDKFRFPLQIFMRITFTSFLTMMLTPFIIWLIQHIALYSQYIDPKKNKYRSRKTYL